MYILFLIAIIPVILLLSYIYKKDVAPEPRSMLTRLFIDGCISILPVIFIELFLDELMPSDGITNSLVLFCITFLSVGIVEEGAKWLITYYKTYNNKEFNHPYDAIVYSVFVSLGFAMVENVLYVCGSGLEVGIMRALLSVPSHAVDAVLMGYFLGLSKREQFNHGKKEDLYLSLSVIIPAIIHTIFDYLIFMYVNTNMMLHVYHLIDFVIFIYILSFIIVNKVSKIKSNYDGSPEI
ncbi:MAG TPA: PrsW family glutamic-type intramembrane protease [Bacilli bacterium]|jgi:RsiW-degrading membrane proteinase PrsW (M82 family)|nr:PrsW family glutamic-type intramembrane protease [Bacilli bacterium]HPZ23334.1 PrsW family glutamic-type intramembrane protease [Bacilli bacterium]HQC83908.1 PrsW family glutamic-type intramembrane protease [Bacilli bacterium]